MAGRGRGITPNHSAIAITGELSTDGLHLLIEALYVIMRHNLPASLMELGCVCMALHYRTIVDANGECPALFVCGDVGTGKSLAMRAGHPRIFLGYSTVLWFTSKVRQHVSL